MSDDHCPVCGEVGYIYLETFKDPDWEQKDYQERDSKVGEFFCSVKHMIVWLLQEGFDIRGEETCIDLSIDQDSNIVYLTLEELEDEDSVDDTITLDSGINLDIKDRSLVGIEFLDLELIPDQLIQLEQGEEA